MSAANLLVRLDGTVQRVCEECPTIFTCEADSDATLCKKHQKERDEQENPCCDSPHYRTIRCRAAPDGTAFADRVCRSCGKRRVVEL